MGAGGTAGQLLESPLFFHTVDGAVTQLKWINNQSLAIGTSLGYFHVWSMAEVSRCLGCSRFTNVKQTPNFNSNIRCRVRGGAEITSIATRQKGGIWRIIMGTLDCHIVGSEWAGQARFQDLFGLDSFTAIPRALSFEENGNIRVFSLHDGCLSVLIHVPVPV